MKDYRPILVTTQEYRIERTLEAFDVFRRLQAHFGSTSVFLLDSVTDLKSRYCTSVIGLNPLLSCRIKGTRYQLEGNDAVVSVVLGNLANRGFGGNDMQGDLVGFLDSIQTAFQVESEQLTPYSFGFMGYLSYDAVRYYEEVPQTTEDDRGLPDVFLQIHQVILHFEEGRIRIVCNDVEGAAAPELQSLLSIITEDSLPNLSGFSSGNLRVEEDVPKETYLESVRQAKALIAEGDIFQVVLSKRDRVIGAIDPLLVYQRLKEVNPSPYMFYVDYGEFRLFGASPEMHLRLENGVAMMRPIAGTTKGKGKTPEEDQQLIEHLLSDEKEQAEHVMLVDLCRNDLGRFCEPGSIHVQTYMQIEEFSHVYHAVSSVQGIVEPGVSPYEAFLATFPAGTLTGAPKIRAMEIIDQVETTRRGPYGGAVGFFDFCGNLNTAIIIRSIIHKDDVSYLQAGAGIVADSVPENEWNECNHKLRALVATVFS